MTGRREDGSDLRVEGLRREKVVFNFFAAKKELRVLRGACFLAGVLKDWSELGSREPPQEHLLYNSHIDKVF
jgi:hypothetical protein